MRLVILCLLVLGWSAAVSGGELWPQFRGPDGQGRVARTQAPTVWGEQQNLRWKTPIRGKGWSSPVVAGDQIWITTSVTHGNPVPGEQGVVSVESVTLYGVCVSRSTGKVLHEVELFEVEAPEAIHSLNSYASPTPCLDESRVYCHFGRNGVACLDRQSGEVLWRATFEIDHYVGAGSSPVLAGGSLVLVCDGADQQYVVGVDPQTGEENWRTSRPPMRSTNPDTCKSFCTPLTVRHEGVEQLVAPAAQWIAGYDPADGRELWRMDHGDGFSLVARPVSDGRLVYFCTSFGNQQVQAVRLGGSGDLGAEGLAWRHDRQAPNQPSPVLHSGRLYLVSDQGVAQCLDAATGEQLWRKRLGGNYSASILQLNDLFYYFSREGVATALDADGDRVLKNELDAGFMATPAIVENQWIVRTETHLYLFANEAVAQAASGSDRR